MQISKIAAGQAGPAVSQFPGGVPAAAATLHDASGQAALADQLKAYHALAGSWRGARQGERAALAQALTESPFGQSVQSALDSFTRAAWAGKDAAPPAPQAQMLKAFDGLSDRDRQIVASMQLDPSGRPAYASADDYRARLAGELEAAQAVARKPDAVTLSPQAQAALAGGGAPQTPPAPVRAAPRPDLAAAMAAYSKAAG